MELVVVDDTDDFDDDEAAAVRRKLQGSFTRSQKVRPTGHRWVRRRAAVAAHEVAVVRRKLQGSSTHSQSSCDHGNIGECGVAQRSHTRHVVWVDLGEPLYELLTPWRRSAWSREMGRRRCGASFRDRLHTHREAATTGILVSAASRGGRTHGM